MATGNTSRRWNGPGHGPASSTYDRGAPPNYTVESPSPSRYDPWELFEERLRTGPFDLPRRVPIHPFHPFRVMMEEDEFWRHGAAMSPGLQQFVRASPLRFTNRFGDQSGGRHLTPAEIDTVLKKLKKETYSPPPRDSAKGNSEKGENEANDQTCSICLEDFFSKQQILRLPCNHGFHSECLTPWVKSHGQCPVCRLDLTGRASTTNNEDNGGQVHATAADEMALLIRAMEEAFAWLNPYQR